MSALETLLKDLAKLPEPQLAEVARFVRRLDPLREARLARRAAALAATAGCLTGLEGEEFAAAVRTEGERLDSRDWQ